MSREILELTGLLAFTLGIACLSGGLMLYALWLGPVVGGAIILACGLFLIARANRGGDA